MRQKNTLHKTEGDCIYSEDEIDWIIDSLVHENKEIDLQDALYPADVTFLEKAMTQVKQDKRFIAISLQRGEYITIIPKKRFIKFLYNLNIRLYAAGLDRLKISQLKNLLRLSLVRSDEEEIFLALLKIAGQIGLLEIDREFVLFPLADILSRFKSLLGNAFYYIFECMIMDEKYKKKIKMSDLLPLLYRSYKNADRKIRLDRNLQIILMRYGLRGDEAKTLEEIGRKYGLTRERVRQIIYKETALLKRNNPLRALLVEFSLSLLMSRKRKKLYMSNEKNELLALSFLSTLGLVALYKFRRFNISYLYAMPKQKKLIKQFDSRLLEIRSIEKKLEEIYQVNGLYLSSADKELMKEEMIKKANKNELRRFIIVETLEHIGHPAHYSYIARTSDKLFPFLKITPREVHITLSRLAERKEIEWTWTGRRGFYALKKWGYKKPDKDLFTSVSIIVDRLFKEVKKPIHFNRVKNELLKTGREFSQGSLYFALYKNPNLDVVDKKYFIPKREKPRTDLASEEDNIDLARLDKAIRDTKIFSDDT